jgi:hypothetical protein
VRSGWARSHSPPPRADVNNDMLIIIENASASLIDGPSVAG